MSNYDDEMRFVLFTNEKTKDSQPDIKGECTINGVKYRLAGWWPVVPMHDDGVPF